jgi:hypothetical protein
VLTAQVATALDRLIADRAPVDISSREYQAGYDDGDTHGYEEGLQVGLQSSESGDA